MPTEERTTERITPDPRVKDAVGLYARRKARMFFLRNNIASATHPVLEAEVRLVEMARAKLLEALLSANSDFMSSLEARSRAEEDLKSEMRRSALSITSNLDMRSSILAEIEDESLDIILIPRDRG